LIEPRIIEDLSGGKEECVVGDVSGVGQRGSRGKGEDEPSVGGNFIRTVIEGKRDADEGIGMVMGSGVIPW